MADTPLHKNTNLEHEGPALGRIHAHANRRKALGYWLGFLQGILASDNIENAEYDPLRAESENFLRLLGDPDAAELIEDLEIWRNEPKEIYEIIEGIIAFRANDFTPNSEKDQLNEFYGFCAGIACDNQITPKEVERLLSKLSTYPNITRDNRIVSLSTAARRSIADGRITPEESNDICSWITHLVGDSASDTGLATFGNVGVIDGAIQDHSEIIFDKRMFVLTGKFSIGPRKAIQGMIADRGGDFKSNVCMNTHYLCVATAASRDWVHSHEGTKIIRALELRNEGKGPQLVHEGALSRALSL